MHSWRRFRSALNHPKHLPKHWHSQTGAVQVSGLALFAAFLVMGCMGGVIAYLLVASDAPQAPPSPTQATLSAKNAPPSTSNASAQRAQLKHPPQKVGAHAQHPPSQQNADIPAPPPGQGPLPPTLSNPDQTGATPPPTTNKDPQNKNPRIDLKAVETALWRTKPKQSGQFNSWMNRFEDQVNVIYLATLRRQQPNASPKDLMPRPVRVAPERRNQLLILQGYIDQNNTPGYQPKSDQFIFAFEQQTPYQKGSPKLSYVLYDDTGYYYRKPGFTTTIQVNQPPAFVNFFVETSWQQPYWRPRFVWFERPRWWETTIATPAFRFYFQSYPGFRVHFRRHYRTYYRPPGWRIHFKRRRIYRRFRRGRWKRRGWGRRKWKRRKWKRRKWKRRGWGRRKF